MKNKTIFCTVEGSNIYIMSELIKKCLYLLIVNLLGQKIILIIDNINFNVQN